MKTSKLLLATLLIFFTCYGCAFNGSAPQSFLREGVDMGYINTIAILPFENNTKDELAARRIRDIASTQIMARGIFDVVDKGIVDAALQEMGIDAMTPLDTPLIKRLGQRLNVQSLIVGTVNNIGENRQGSFTYPEITLTLELIESESALVLWRCSDTQSGYSVSDRLFGLDPMDSFQITVKLLDKILATIPK